MLVCLNFEIICCLACALPGVPDTLGINNGRSKFCRKSSKLPDIGEKHLYCLVSIDLTLCLT